MLKPSAWVIAGAVIATAGVVAHAPQAAAQENAAPQVSARQGAMPWYQRFTTSNGVTESITGHAENDRLSQPIWTPTQRWGVTVNVQEPQRIQRSPEGVRGEQTAVGAFFQFTPRARVGAEVRVEENAPGVAAAPQDERDQPVTGVRIESAFRF